MFIYKKKSRFTSSYTQMQHISEIRLFTNWLDCQNGFLVTIIVVVTQLMGQFDNLWFASTI